MANSHFLSVFTKKEVKKLIKNLRRQMKKATREFKFDHAIAFRNALLDLEKVSC